MKITKQRLKEIIKEELNSTFEEKELNESVANFIKPNFRTYLSATIPFGVLQQVLDKNPKLRDDATNAADPMGQRDAFAKVVSILNGAEVPISSGGKAALGKMMDVRGFIKYAEEKGAFHR